MFQIGLNSLIKNHFAINWLLPFLMISGYMFFFNWDLLTDASMLTHDSLRSYGMFHYYTSSLLEGEFPYWNPYMHAGEPFYYVSGMLQHLNPTYFFIFFIKLIFNPSLFLLYTLYALSFLFVFYFGSFWFFRIFFEDKRIAYCCLFFLLVSSLNSDVVRQMNFVFSISWFPVCLGFLYRFLKVGDGVSLVFGAFFLGILMSSLYGLYAVYFLIFFLGSLAITGDIPIKGIFQRRHIPFALFSIGLLALMSFPNLALLFLQDTIVPVARTLHGEGGSSMTEGISVSLEHLGGTPGQISNFLQVFLPHLFHVYFFLLRSTPMSEAFIYFGVLPLALFCSAFIYRPNRKMAGLFLCFSLIVLLFLGNKLVHSTFYYIFPLADKIRHMEFFFIFVVFTFLLIVGTALQRLLHSHEKNELSLMKITLIALFIVLGSVITGTFLIDEKVSKTFIFSESLMHISLYATLLVIGAFFIIKRPEYKVYGIIFLALITLLETNTINRKLLHYNQQPRIFFTALEDALPIIYQKDRISEIPEKAMVLYRYFYYLPALLRSFAAFDTTVIPNGSYLYEINPYYQLRTSGIKTEKLENMAGVTTPRLRLFDRVVAAEKNDTIQKIRNSPETILNNVLFLETEAKNIPTEMIVAPKENLAEITRRVTGNITRKSFSANSIELEVEVPQDCFLYYSDGYDKYWEAVVNGKKTEVFPANITFKAILLKKGINQVKLEFNPYYFKYGMYLYLLIVAIGFAAILLLSFRTSPSVTFGRNNIRASKDINKQQ